MIRLRRRLFWSYSGAKSGLRSSSSSSSSDCCVVYTISSFVERTRSSNFYCFFTRYSVDRTSATFSFSACRCNI
jgi:hypothetical protein